MPWLLSFPPPAVAEWRTLGPLLRGSWKDCSPLNQGRIVSAVFESNLRFFGMGHGCLQGPLEFGAFTYGSGERGSALGQMSLQAWSATALARGRAAHPNISSADASSGHRFLKMQSSNIRTKQNPKLLCQSGSRQRLGLRAEVFGRLRDLCSEARGD